MSRSAPDGLDEPPTARQSLTLTIVWGVRCHVVEWQERWADTIFTLSAIDPAHQPGMGRNFYLCANHQSWPALPKAPMSYEVSLLCAYRPEQEYDGNAIGVVGLRFEGHPIIWAKGYGPDDEP